jgi:hypothetical protein
MVEEKTGAIKRLRQELRVIRKIEEGVLYHVSVYGHSEQILELRQFTANRVIFSCHACSQDWGHSKMKVLPTSAFAYFEFFGSNYLRLRKMDEGMLPVYVTWPWHSKKLERMLRS